MKIRFLISRSLIFSLALFFPAASAAQHDMKHMHVMPRATNARLDMQNDEAAQVLTLRLGPLSLPAHAGMNVAQAPDLSAKVPIDGWFTGYTPSLTDASGKPLPSRLLHHVAVYNLARADFLCPSKPEHIFGAGGEMTVWPVTPGIGYRVEKGDTLRVGTMFHNPTETSYPDVFLQVKISYEPAGTEAAKLRNVYPAWIDVKECGNSSYDLKPGKNVTTGEFTLQFTGALVGLGGHLHDYGHKVEVVDETRKQSVTINAVLDPDGRLKSIPVRMFPAGFRLEKGDLVKVTATYDNTAGKPLPDGAMGIAVGYFLPSNNQEMEVLKRR